MLRGRRYQAINNRVTKLPDFGIEIVEGSLNVSSSWESHPTGSLTILAIPESEIGKYRANFNKIGKEFDIYGYEFLVDSYAETKDTLEGPGVDEIISTYQLGVNLVGKWQSAANCPIFIRTKSSINNISIASTLTLAGLARRGDIRYVGYNHEIEIPQSSGNGYTLSFENSVRQKLRVNKKMIDFTGDAIRTKDWRSGNTWTLTRNEILDTVQSNRQRPIFYSRTRLQGKDGILERSKSKVDKERLKRIFSNDPLVLKPPVVRTLEEGDVAVQGIPQDTRADKMPSNVKTLGSMDLNFDLSGPRKTLRRTTTVNNQVMKEVVRQYGFAYHMRDVYNLESEAPDAPLNTPTFLVENPQQYWRLIEEQTTSYIYKPLTGSMELEATDLSTKKKLKIKYVDETGKAVNTTFKKRYLTEIVTQGWRLGRFQTETENTETDSRFIDLELSDPELSDLDREYFNLQKESIEFQRFYLKERKRYLLVDPQEYYDKIEEIPFETQKVTRKDLGLTTRINDSVLIATPSKDFVYPMMVMAETSQTHSFATMPNPENVFIKDERSIIRNDDSLTNAQKVLGLKELKLLPELTAGEDSFSVIKRTIKPSKNTNRRLPKNKKVEDDVYVEYSYSASNQDQNFKNSVQNIKFAERFGRPASAQVYPDVYVRKSELVNNKDKNIENTKTSVYYLDSAKKPPGCTTEGSVAVETSILSEALSTAKIELSLKNFLSASEETMSLAWFHPAIRPGDYVNSVDSFTKSRKRVKSVSFNISYQGFTPDLGQLATCGGTSLTLGIFDPLEDGKVNMRREFESNEGGLKTSANFNIKEEVLGDAPLMVNLRTRRNR